MRKIRDWWGRERIGRVEEGTSQDFFPTNGEALTFALFMFGIGVGMLAVGIGVGSGH